MEQKPPVKRFNPEPVETTFKSSRNPLPEAMEMMSRPARKFAPEPVEATSKSTRRFAPEPVETTIKSTRRFAPEPVETTVKSTRRFVPEPVEVTTKSSKRFAPEPVETTVRSSKDKGPARDGPKAPRRFAVEPVETVLRSSRAIAREQDKKEGESSKTTKRPPRKFAPQLIETAKRSRKAGDETPAVLPSDKTEVTPEDRQSRTTRPKPLLVAPGNSPSSSQNSAAQLSPFRELRRIGSPLAVRSDSRASSRSHSFRVPDLDPIESSESGGSGPPSLSTSPSSSLEGADHMYKHATRLRESVDERFSGYLLRLAARAAEKQLKEAAMAAFPNSDFHEPVDHFVDRDSDVDMSEPSRHNSSFTKINWELREMQKHQEKLQETREKERLREDTELMSTKGPENNPWSNPILAFLAENDISGTPGESMSGWQREIGLKEMREGARPPMLGSDIKFPRCESPEPARFDVTQGSEHLRTQMCYLSELARAPDPEGLWENNKKKTGSTAPLWSNNPSRRPSNHSGGLWGGFCKASENGHPLTGFSGIMTPRPESLAGMEHMHHLPSSPALSTSGIASLSEQLEVAKAIENEFDDEFVTQVYNYLSLGYPAIGRDFDGELHKISGIPMAELRQDDYLARSRGYIRLGRDENGMDGIEEEMCARWRALRLYIKEWAKQHPLMAQNSNPQEGWGVLARRGSWAW